MLNTFASFSGYYPSVVLTTYDINGDVSNAANAYTYNYKVTIANYRPATYSDATTSYVIKYDVSNASNTVNTSTIPSVKYAKLQDHSPPVAGNFSLTLNGVTLAYTSGSGYDTGIPYNIDAATLASYINTAFGYKGVEVDIIGPGSTNGNTYIISFVGVNTNIPQIVIDNTNLTGGTNNNPSVVVTTIR